MSARQQIDLEDVLAEDGGAATGPTDQQLKTIAYLGQLLVTRQAEVAALLAELKEAEARLRQTAEADLPEAMTEAGVRSFELADGTGLDLNEVVHASVSKDRMPTVAEWLRANDHDEILKAQVVTTFAKGQVEDAMALVDRLSADRFNAQLVQAIHPQTLGAWVREMRAKVAEALANDEPVPEFPEELFGVYVRTVASVREVKKSRKRAT